MHQLSGEDFLEPLSLILDELQILDGLSEEWYIKLTLKYLAIAGKIPDKEKFVKAVEGKLSEETAMNLLQEFEKDGFKKGIQQGLEKGKLEGKLEGIQQEKLHMAFKLMEDGISLEQIAHWTELPLSRLQDLLKESRH